MTKVRSQVLWTCSLPRRARCWGESEQEVGEISVCLFSKCKASPHCPPMAGQVSLCRSVGTPGPVSPGCHRSAGFRNTSLSASLLPPPPPQVCSRGDGPAVVVP